ncbi:electron transfer flavoprotein beta subunit/FixA family protein [Georgenia yuyongxinii]|uniref:Electron transfer flavoprotein small subunit n=1 Tax=Georgenia yuyongxinii TaxID=2589797 RepID=A0A5B8C2P6_9MICO|nr:electron transfer flavoprotein beta subunit/FixA family protein [Georgenia yuyongxinii]QDC24558.1 electron transfer flavoprotein beta subunit/FixA family protein [Georgenia yuyongxinii]
MKIAVAYKWAPNPQDASVSQEGTVDWGRAKAAISEYDQVALEVGRRLADSAGAELVGISAGPADAGSSMARKAALSRGLDRLAIVTDEALAGATAGRTARVLAEVVDQVGDVDLVLTGDSSVDLGAQLVPSVLGAVLGWPVLSNVTAITGSAGDLTVERSREGGTQTLRVTGPAVLAVAPDAAMPSVPGMKDILAAGKKPTDVLDVPVPDAEPVSVVATAPPEMKARKRQIIDGSDPAAAAAELVAALRADNLV